MRSPAVAQEDPAALMRLAREIAALPPQWAIGGCLDAPVLERIAQLSSARRIRASAETGAGSSTLLLSHASERHLVFSLAEQGRLDPVRASPLLRRDAVAFVEGPTQQTLPRHRFEHPLQLVLLDGPHSYPFPDMEYYFLYPQLEAGGLLILDDIHIPTIHNLFRFVREDEMFAPLGVLGKTAFFERSTAPGFPTLGGDDWQRQAFNSRRFPLALDSAGNVTSPFSRALRRARRILRGLV